MAEQDVRELWKGVLKAVSERIPRSKFLTWFKNTALLELHEGTVIVGVPTEMSFNNIAEQFFEALTQGVQQGIGSQIQHVKLKVDGSLHKGDSRVIDVARMFPKTKKKEKDVDGGTAVAPIEEPVEEVQEGRREVRLIEGISSKVLNPKYTLENFIMGPETQLAYAATSAVARSPGDAYNPLFIYGGVGLGKTHLLQAAGNEILRRFPKKKVVYVTSEKFTNELVHAIATKTTDAVRKKYREIDVLIVDDIQFFANKTQTQVEFFHTFNELYQAKKQIILSSDRPPQELKELEPRLQSRFEWGMIVDVQFPDFETRCAILHVKCQERGVFISPEVIEFIAHNVHSSIRELEGVLNQAIAMYEFQQVTPTINSVGPLLLRLNKNKKIYGYAGSIDQNRRKATSLDEIVDVVSHFYGVSTQDLLGESRKKELVNARQMAMYIAKQDLHMTFEKIGEKMGGRLHSTVMHSCNKLQKEMKKDEQIKRQLNSMRMELGLL